MVSGGTISSGSWGWLAPLLSDGLVLFALAMTGGAVAWLVARRWEALVIGAIAQAMASWWIRPWADGEVASLGGWLAGAMVGVVLALAAPDRLVEDDTSSRGRATRWVVVLGIACVAGSVALVWWTAHHHDQITSSLSTSDALVGVECSGADQVDGDGCEPAAAAGGAPFEGDTAGAERTAVQIRTALGALAEATPDPTVEELRAVLAPWEVHDVRVGASPGSSFTDGADFQVRTADGCIAGSVRGGEVTVSVGGSSVDGACVAVDGH